MTILFLHGWQSTPGGIKPTYFKDHSHTVLNPALPDENFDEAVRIAQEEFDQHHPDVVVGSSRGGAVAMNINSGLTPLVLLCPAWKRWGSATTVKPNTVILHSKADEVVPFTDSQELLRNSGLPESSLIVVGTEHRLADEESLKKMLEAVENGKGTVLSSSARQDGGMFIRWVIYTQIGSIAIAVLLRLFGPYLPAETSRILLPVFHAWQVWLLLSFPLFPIVILAWAMFCGKRLAERFIVLLTGAILFCVQAWVVNALH